MSACQMIVFRRKDRGVMGKGTHQFTADAEPCGHPADESGMCARHRTQAAKYKAANQRRRAAQS